MAQSQAQAALDTANLTERIVHLAGVFVATVAALAREIDALRAERGKGSFVIGGPSG